MVLYCVVVRSSFSSVQYGSTTPRTTSTWCRAVLWLGLVLLLSSMALLLVPDQKQHLHGAVLCFMSGFTTVAVSSMALLLVPDQQQYLLSAFGIGVASSMALLFPDYKTIPDQEQPSKCVVIN